MAATKLTEKPTAETVGSDDKVVIIQGGKVMLAGVEALGSALGLTEAEAALADIDAVIGGTQ